MIPPLSIQSLCYCQSAFFFIFLITVQCRHSALDLQRGPHAEEDLLRTTPSPASRSQGHHDHHCHASLFPSSDKGTPSLISPRHSRLVPSDALPHNKTLKHLDCVLLVSLGPFLKLQLLTVVPYQASYKSRADARPKQFVCSSPRLPCMHGNCTAIAVPGN